MNSLMQSVVRSSLHDVDFERTRAAMRIRKENEIRYMALETKRIKQELLECRARLEGIYPVHGDVLVDENGDAIAILRTIDDGDVRSVWISVVDNETTVHAWDMDISQQYIDRNNGVAEWLWEPVDDQWDD